MFAPTVTTLPKRKITWENTLKSTLMVWNIPAMSATEFIGLLFLLECTSAEGDVKILSKIIILISEPTTHSVLTEEFVNEKCSLNLNRSHFHMLLHAHHCDTDVSGRPCCPPSGFYSDSVRWSNFLPHLTHMHTHIMCEGGRSDFLKNVTFFVFLV